MDSWYFNRLRTMSIAEAYFRIKQLIKGAFEEKFRYKKILNSAAFDSKSDILGINALDLNRVPDSLKIFGIDFKIGNPFEINWNKDIISGEVFPSIFHRKINIRSNPNLSAKCVWEINRLQFLTGLCMNYKVTNDRSELDLFMQINKSWSLQNPYLAGVNWYSNIEINLRLITWFLCWEILDTERLVLTDRNFKVFVEKDWLQLIRAHCIYSYDNPSKYSSANNHLISEYAGLFIASSKWQFKDSEKWINYSKRGLENEIIRQHSINGINKEEAAEYIQFITDFFLLSFIVGEKTNNSFSKQFKQYLYKIFCYIYDILDSKGNFPKYGDEDDGKCFIIDFDDKFNNFRSLLTSGAIIFNDPVLKTKSNGFDIKSRFLFGEPGKEIYESIPEVNCIESSKFFRDEGHFIFKKQGNGKEIYMHFDAAPLGYLSIAAHGHADALSFILNVDGHSVFIDPGTYTYHTEPEWRHYFIGTLAHNTIRINQKDQAVKGGPTLWTKHYKTNVIDQYLSEENDYVIASHSGYLSENARHIRKITFDRFRDEFQILDTIVVRKKKKMLIEIPFHIHPDLKVFNTATNVYRISKDHLRMTEFHVDKKLEPVIINGQTEPQILGWYSHSFLKKEPANVIYCMTNIDCTTTFEFVIKII